MVTGHGAGVNRKSGCGSGPDRGNLSRLGRVFDDMETPGPPKLILGFVLGSVAGVVGLLFGQSMFRGDSRDDASGAAAVAGPDRVKRLQFELEKVRKEKSVLGVENARLKGDLAEAGGQTGEGELADAEPEKGGKPTDSFLEVMMAIGAKEATRKVDSEVALLAERLNLTEPQQEELRAALLAKLERQQAAGKLMIKGEATIADLASADEDNFTEVDAAMAELLSDSQLEEYSGYQDEREVARIERKSNEDLDGLHKVGDLTEEQAEQAWDVFVELNTADKPGGIPEGTTEDEFFTYIDKAIDDRIGRLQPILTGPQLDAYRIQTESFRAMVTAIVTGGTGGEER